MSLGCAVSERLARLREMRESLCKKEKTWKEAFAARDWIVDQLQTLQKMTDDPDMSKSDIKDRISDILCALNPEGDENE